MHSKLRVGRLPGDPELMGFNGSHDPKLCNRMLVEQEHSPVYDARLVRMPDGGCWMLGDIVRDDSAYYNQSFANDRSVKAH